MSNPSRGATGAEPIATSSVVDETIERAVDFINGTAAELHQQIKTGLLAIGDYVLRVFFKNDSDVLHRRGRGGNHADFRKLSQHPRLQMSLAGLHSAVAIAVQERQLIAAGVPSLERLTDSHKVELARLVKSPSLKTKIVQAVVAEQLSVRQMVARIKQLNGQNAVPADGFVIPQVLDKLLSLDVSRWAKRERLRALSGDQKEACLLALQKAQAIIISLREALEQEHAVPLEARQA